ncbi:MAG: glycosyltransferase [Bacillota bacterium]
MRIAMLSESYHPYVSGVVRSIDTFSMAMRKHGHQVHLFVPSPGHGYAGEQPTEDRFYFPSLALPGQVEYRQLLPFYPGLTAKLRALEVDIVHVHSPFIVGRLGLSAARKLHVPLVFTHHTLYAEYIHYAPLPGLSRWVIPPYLKWFGNRCDLVVAPTPPVEQLIRQEGIRRPVAVIPTGIDLEEFENPDRKWLRTTLGIQLDTDVILCVSRFGPEKNLPFLLQCLPSVWACFPDTRLVLVGTGPMERQIRDMIRELSPHGKIHLLARRLSRKELANCYSGADIFAFPSYTETQGIIIGEAQAAGLPVVTINAWGVGSLVRHGIDGLLVTRDAEAFSQAIISLLASRDLRQRLGSAGKEAVRSMSATVTADKMLRAYRGLVR